MFRQSRRRTLKSIVAGGVVYSTQSIPESWLTPVVKSVVLPAHAQTSPCGGASFIRVNSPATENDDFLRVIAVLDAADNVLARCGNGGTEDIIIEASSLASGTYRVVGGSIDDLEHTVRITTECGTTTATAPTGESCNNLIATVSLPEGNVENENGQATSGGSMCPGDAPSIGCLQGET